MKKLNVVFLLALSFALFSNTIKSKENKIVAKNAEVKLVGTGFLFTEGPAVNDKGQVYFTDQPNDKIHIWDEKEGVSLYKEGTGRSNGTYFNAKGQLVVCADEYNQLGFFDDNKKLNIIHEGFEGKHLNAPNDLWINPKNGGIYFTDPYYHRKYWGKDHKQVQDTQGVYYLSPEGEITRVIDDYKRPNGIIGSPDGETLYVADISGRTIWRYTINNDGSLSNKTFFVPRGSDGMTIDDQGNVYLTWDKVYVYNPMGALIQEIALPEEPSNVCFGGKKRKTLFITAVTSVYTLKMKVKGVN